MLPLMLLMLLLLFEVLRAAWSEPEPPEAFAQPKLHGRRAQQWKHEGIRYIQSTEILQVEETMFFALRELRKLPGPVKHNEHTL